MIRQDYLLNLIRQLGEFLRKALHAEESGSQEHLEQKLEELSEEILGLPPSMILTSSPEEVVNLFQLSDRMVIERCYLTAEIHRLKAQTETVPQHREQLEQRAIYFFRLVLDDLTGELRTLAEEHLSTLEGPPPG